MGKIHYIILSDSLQYSVGCVKEDIFCWLCQRGFVHLPFITQDFKLFQLFFLVLIVLRFGRTLWTKPYSFISRTNVFKKRRSVDSLTVRPVAASQFALATRRLCLSFSMALRALGFQP